MICSREASSGSIYFSGHTLLFLLYCQLINVLGQTVDLLFIDNAYWVIHVPYHQFFVIISNFLE